MLLAGVSTIFFTFVSASSAVSQTWTSTGSMSRARFAHTTTRLPDGRVLAVGGTDCSTGPLASAELYDSVSGTWTPAASMKTARDGHTATLLPNGKVLVAGGVNNFSTLAGLASAELYDPTTNAWSDTGAMAVGRYVHTATLLASGKVLVAGGESGFPQVFLASAELYDPATGTWSSVGSLIQARDYHTATLLKNGKVLVAGGHVIGTVFASAELYDPGTQTWSSAADLNEPRLIHTATLLSDGQVLVAGGFNVSPYSAVSSAELYNPLADSWTPTASLGVPRYAHTATALLDGTVLVAGGFNGSYLASAEIYDPTSHLWTATGALVGAREGHSAILLSSGAALAVGGYLASCLDSAELYNGPPPSVIAVVIDIKPGSFPNSINPKSQGKIPVAILTTDSFDATTIDPTTVLFGRTGAEAAPVHFAFEDVDGDGDTDMIFHFNTQDTGIQCGDTSASLTGETFSGQMFQGSDSVKTAGCK